MTFWLMSQIQSGSEVKARMYVSQFLSSQNISDWQHDLQFQAELDFIWHVIWVWTNHVELESGNNAHKLGTLITC